MIVHYVMTIPYDAMIIVHYIMMILYNVLIIVHYVVCIIEWFFITRCRCGRAEETFWKYVKIYADTHINMYTNKSYLFCHVFQFICSELCFKYYIFIFLISINRRNLLPYTCTNLSHLCPKLEKICCLSFLSRIFHLYGDVTWLLNLC